MSFPESFNLADFLLDARMREGLASRVAVRTDHEQFTYAHVHELANRFAQVMESLGVEQEHRVILALPDIPEFVGALFGILKLGAVVVMVNPDLSADELAFHLEFSRARLAVVHADKLPLWQGLRARALLSVGGGDPSFEREAARFSGSRENTPTHRDDPALWIFSGGTTGRPKAAVQTHRSFANTTERYARAFLGYQATDVTLAVPKLYFGYATGSNLFFPFSVGATCCLFPDRSTPEALFARIARHRPTLLVNVPTMVHKMVQSGAGQDLSCLRLATSAGEALPPSLYQAWRDAFGVELVDGLGTAEMWHIFLSNRPGEVKPGTLGRAVPGFEVKVADDEGRELPVGEVGRLWVRGHSRALGYWQQHDQSMEAFRGEWFASQDMVCQDGEGFVTHCGRGDDLLKVGGKWLAPQEVEDCLLAHPRVREVAVVGVRSADGLTRPRAVVVAEGAGPELALELQQHCLQRLAAYKHPREVVFVAQLPRTHLGKIDRGQLRT